MNEKEASANSWAPILLFTCQYVQSMSYLQGSSFTHSLLSDLGTSQQLTIHFDMQESNHKPVTPKLSYQDHDFLSGDDARPVRILSEYLAPLSAFKKNSVHDTIVFFGSARQKEDGAFSKYYRDARELARLITAWSLSLSNEDDRFIICTGGGGGLMEAAT